MQELRKENRDKSVLRVEVNGWTFNETIGRQSVREMSWLDNFDLMVFILKGWSHDCHETRE